MDKNYLSKKREKGNDEDNKSENNKLINLNMDNPFFASPTSQTNQNNNTNVKKQFNPQISNNSSNHNNNDLINNKSNSYSDHQNNQNKPNNNNIFNSNNAFSKKKEEITFSKNNQSNNNSINNNSSYKNTNGNNVNTQVASKVGFQSEKKKLPIENYRDLILNYIKNNQVIVIAGETGCGKTTQVPKYIYEDYLSRNDKTLNMIITQPRRIAAVSIANRLKEELNVNLGVEVGYHVGMNPVFDSERTRILIVTTGIFLQRLIHEKELPNISHVILDEVHERDIDIDFTMILIKHILKNHPNIKLILMSATISTQLFSNYFSKEDIASIDDIDYYRNFKGFSKIEKESAWDDVKSIENQNLNIENSWGSIQHNSAISKQNYENSITCLSSILTKIDKSSNKSNTYSSKEFLNANENNPAPIIRIDEKIYPIKIEYLREIIEKYMGEFAHQLPVDFQFDKSAPKIADYLFEISAMLIKNIHKGERNFSSILVFLPGFFEIQMMNEKILDCLDKNENNVEILHLHSGLSDEEQQLVFKPNNRRKIILSTNIAESSITIPDIYYVIDFCLCKELKFNIKTNHETLELNWASKASSNQRAGRAGRVTNGFVYRLIDKEFYMNQIEDFSSPELLRIPLEKLILKIKVWNCGEPEKILGRAIQPPNIKNIEAAISNLQNFGALTIPNDKSQTGELTELGKVYSELPIDIKYSRLIMLSFCYDMIEPAIISCAILSQEKYLFRNRLSSSELFEIRKYFDRGLNNDFTLYYNAYKTWSKEYGNEGQYEYSRRYMRNVSNNEKDWCAQHDLDYIVLREVKVLIADLKIRLKKLNLYNESSTKNFDFSKPDTNFFFQIVLAGAFYGKFIKCQFFNSEKIQKLNKCKEYVSQHAITVKGNVLDIKDNQLSDFFRKFGKISYFKRYGEEVIVSYCKENYQDSIKKVILSGGYRYNMTEFVLDYKPVSNNEKEEFVKFQLKRPDYLFQLRYYDLFSQNQVEIEHTSVNHVIIGENEKSVSSFFLITEHYHTKKQKFHSRITAKLPEIPMLDFLLMLIFSPYVIFFADDDNKQYHMFRILGSELEYRFTHLFSSVDVEEINYIRSLMNNIIKDLNDETKVISQRETLKKQIKNLIYKKRAKIINKPEWWSLLFKYYPHLEKKKYYYEKDNQPNYNQVSSENKLNFEKLKKNNDFLPQIKKLEGIKDHRLFMDDGKLEIEEERNCFIEMRNTIIKKQEDLRNMINLTETEVVCKVCGSYLCMAKSLSGGSDKNEFHEISGFIGNFMLVIDFNDEITKGDDYCKDMLNEYEYDPNNIEVSWVSCSKKHILGILIKGKYYITDKSKVELIFPTNRKENWSKSFFQENYKKIKTFEESCLVERKKRIQNLYCELCGVKLKDANDYIFHIDKYNLHKQNMVELIEEDF